MRFAFKTAPQNSTWSHIQSVWLEGDQIELFESAWTFDHFYPLSQDTTGPCLEGWIILSALAQATERLRLGVLVSGIHYRHPAVLANMAASLDIVSGGRLELGIGAGWNEEESAAYGMELGSRKQRSDRFEEACQVIVDLLTKEWSDFSGEYYTITHARCEPKPVQKPHPPICIGGGGERRTLRTTARFAQHWNFGGGELDVFDHKLDVLRQHCADLGRDPKEITISTHLRMLPGMDPKEVAELAATFAEHGADLGIVQLPVPYTPAVLAPLADALAQVNR
ncbi:MAG TPA: LLM class F420-dependent oxidoreductase [Pseudonocardiaceae bacterium]|jgi:F420-dependent oxidoreductase-like protein|nr:LLM class F420-dependent oxidoreductase [Pseudonocardiaceae bacterium]